MPRGSKNLSSKIMGTPAAAWVKPKDNEFLFGQLSAGRIGPDGRLSICKTKWIVEGAPAGYQIISADMSAYVEYTQYEFACRTKTLTWSGRGQGDTITGEFNFGSDTVAGDLVCTISNLMWRHPTTGATIRANDRTLRWSVVGENPSKRSVRDELGVIELQIICFLESSFRQFGSDGLPLRGPSSSSKGGFGLMQIDNPKPTCRQLFSWKDNVAAGISLYRKKVGEVARHFANERKGHPERRELTPQELKRALYANYNKLFYYVWSQTAGDWVPGPLVDYADNAMEMEEAVNSGNPPNGWN